MNVTDQKLLTLKEASEFLPGKVAANTLRRWSTEGIGGIKLKAWRLGRCYFTSREALEEFVCARSASVNGTAATPVKRVDTPSHRAAEAALDDLGV